MSRASALAAAADYLSEALTSLDGATRSLRLANAPEVADRARVLHDRAEPLYAEVCRTAAAAHRAERPEFYDESGRWIGRKDGEH
jgi:hypothetical protein